MIRIPRTKRALAAYIIAVFAVSFSVFATTNSAPLKISLAPASDSTSTAVLGEADTLHKIVKVIDGDTFEIESGEKVRLIGVDAPETTDPRKSVQCFGLEASEFATLLLLNKEVKLVKDVSDKDSFGRLLRYVYLEDFFVNKEMVAAGYAYAKSFPPDVAHMEEFRQVQQEAVVARQGLWGVKCSS